MRACVRACVRSCVCVCMPAHVCIAYMQSLLSEQSGLFEFRCTSFVSFINCFNKPHTMEQILENVLTTKMKNRKTITHKHFQQFVQKMCVLLSPVFHLAGEYIVESTCVIVSRFSSEW